MDAVLEAEELPAGVARLDAGLADVDRDAPARDVVSVTASEYWLISTQTRARAWWLAGGACEEGEEEGEGIRG